MSNEEMPVCPACGRLHLVSTCMRRLAERVAKLEARTNAAWGPIEPFELPRVAPTFEELVAKVGPLPSGQLASAGGAPKRCLHGVPSHLGCWNCTSHAVKVGDVVMDEPPAEQPSGCDCLKIETTRGLDPTGCVCGCACHWDGIHNAQCPSCKGTITRDDVPRHGYGPGRCGPAEQPSRQETGGDCGVPGCHACTAMRDRAKAKAAEHVVEHMRPLMVSEAGRTLMAKAAEPSAPAAGTLSEELQSILDAVTRGAMPAPKCDPDPPREVAPDRTQAGSGGQSDDDADEEAMIHDAARLVRRLQRLHPDDGTGSPTNLGWLARYERWRR